jgi:hypothetical protein
VCVSVCVCVCVYLCAGLYTKHNVHITRAHTHMLRRIYQHAHIEHVCAIYCMHACAHPHTHTEHVCVHIQGLHVHIHRRGATCMCTHTKHVCARAHKKMDCMTPHTEHACARTHTHTQNTNIIYARTKHTYTHTHTHHT